MKKWFGNVLATCVVAMVLFSFANVCLRYLFNIIIIPMQELVLYLHAFVFMLGIAYCYLYDKHVRIDIFYQKFSSWKKSRVELFGTLFLLLPFFTFLLYISYDYVLSSWQKLEGSSEAGGIPFVFGLKSLLLILPVLMIVLSTKRIIKER